MRFLADMELDFWEGTSFIVFLERKPPHTCWVCGGFLLACEKRR